MGSCNTEVHEIALRVVVREESQTTNDQRQRDSIGARLKEIFPFCFFLIDMNEYGSTLGNISICTNDDDGDDESQKFPEDSVLAT